MKCLNCHTEIGLLINLKKGFHSSDNVISKECKDCHSDHFGRKFQIIKFDKNKFDHSLSGFNLLGKHKNLDCEKCHNKEFIQSTEIRKRKKTFLGLEQTCNTCHEDYHKAQLKNDCESCHDFNAFAPATKFDHSNSKFKLNGKHLSVACVNCHPVNITQNSKFQKFIGISFKSCENCHKDPHNNRLGKDCKSCHTTDGFNILASNQKFNHSLTRFPLIGLHQQVNCDKCHKPNVKKLSFTNCLDCHTDFHKGQFVENDCSNCHSELGFSPSKFSIIQHDKSRFKLTGAHISIPCNECHYKEKQWIFKIQDLSCISCHNNIHKDFISPKFLGDNKCENCHTTDSWKDVTFDHNKTKFNLLGKHKEINCSSCHFKNFKNERKQVFINLSFECSSCHKDNHQDQFSSNGKTECQRCHTFDNWQISIFNHSNTRFKLDGQHEKVPCIKCHTQSIINSVKTIKYKFEDISCKSCHL